MKTTRQRLDVLIVERGLAASRDRARRLILAGAVSVAGHPGAKPGDLVAGDASIDLLTPDHPYVGRGGLKLAHVLDVFATDVTGDDALDVGASTGGFSDVLLKRGARSVVALDVGHGQLAWPLRTDPRVTVLERVNARSLRPDDLPAGHRDFDIITVDVSFISLSLVLPALVPLLRPGACLVALVKPQFEAGRSEVGKGGLVRDPAVHQRVVDEVRARAEGLGLETVGTAPSPIEGADGNREFFLVLRRGRASAEGTR